MKERVDFIGIGAIKSGSTWVAQCLSEHPEIACRYKKGEKEFRFFNTPDWGGIFEGLFSNYEKGLDWYLRQLPDKKGATIRGEVSVSYLPDPLAATRIKNAFPDIKILVILREPVSMLYSLFNFLSSGITVQIPRTFEEFMSEEKYRKLGMYAEQLKRYRNTFLPKNLHVIIFDDIREEPEQVLCELYMFLEVDKNFKPTVLERRVNVAFAPRFSWLKKVSQRFLLGVKDIGFIRLHEWLYKNKALFRIYSIINRKEVRREQLSKRKREEYKEYFATDVRKLEKFIKRDL